jgi:Trypsin-like peptidase domain
MKSPGRVVFTLLALVLVTACAGKAPSVVEAPTKPDMSKIVRVSGRWTLGSACPIGPHTALSAAHVVDPRPFDREIPLSPVVFSQGPLIDTFRAEYSFAHRDLAVLTTESTLEYYRIAVARPQAGDSLYLTGFDWRDVKRAFADRMWEVKDLRVVAGLLIYTPPGDPGTSGSCVLNQAGEVVAINIARKGVGKFGTEEVGLGVLIAGEIDLTSVKESK